MSCVTLYDPLLKDTMLRFHTYAVPNVELIPVKHSTLLIIIYIIQIVLTMSQRPVHSYLLRTLLPYSDIINLTHYLIIIYSTWRPTKGIKDQSTR